MQSKDKRKHYVYCILGKFASGKTTIAKMLEERYDAKRVISCTTRNKRGGEREGVDYFFISDNEFEKLASSKKLVAINRVPIIETNDDISMFEKIKKIFTFSGKAKHSKKYGVPIDKIDLSKGSYICVIEPSGYFDLVEKLGKENVKSIYLDINDKERWLRALNREANPDVNDIVAKHLEELRLYDGFEEKCDKLIQNMGTSDDATLEIYDYMKACESV